MHVVGLGHEGLLIKIVLGVARKHLLRDDFASLGVRDYRIDFRISNSIYRNAIILPSGRWLALYEIVFRALVI